MTFEELLGFSSQELQSLSDEKLLEILGPLLKDCPPIDLVLIQEKEKKKEAEKLVKKLEQKKDIKPTLANVNLLMKQLQQDIVNKNK